MTSKRRVFRVYYPLPGRPDRQRFRLPMRDAEAGMRLTLTLATQGFEFCDDLYQPPSMGPDLVVPGEVNEGFFCETDLILWVGRPPMDDAQFGGRRQFPRSYTWIEDVLMRGPLRKKFKVLSRQEVVLSDEAARMSSEIAAHQSMTFYVNGSAGYQSFGSPITQVWQHFKKTPLTPVFLVYTPSAWPGGPAFLCAFGMGSIETFVWSRLLSTRLADRLCTTEFLMGELRTCPVPQDSETTKPFDSWGFEILGEAPSPIRRGTSGTPPPSTAPGSLAASPAE